MRPSIYHCCCSVTELHLTLWPHELQHARLSCPSPWLWSSSWPLSWWCHPTISFPIAHFSFCHQSFPASGSFPMSWLFTSGGWNIGASTSTSVLPWILRLISFRIHWFDLLSIQGTLKSLLQPHRLKASILQCSIFFMVQLSHPHMTSGKTIVLTIQTFASKVMSLF